MTELSALGRTDPTRIYSEKSVEPEAKPSTPKPAERTAIAAPASFDSRVGEFAKLARKTSERVLGEVSYGRKDMSSSAVSSKMYWDKETATASFKKGADRLADVNHWNDLSGLGNGKFKLFDSKGHPVSGRSASVGDFVQIKLPGLPGASWVRVESMSSSPTKFSMTVRPTYDPTKSPLTPNITAHFFTSEATNTLSIERIGATVEARVEGRHEKANVGAECGDGLAALHRVVAESAWGPQVGIGGGRQLNGAQQRQWNDFTSRLLKA